MSLRFALTLALVAVAPVARADLDLRVSPLLRAGVGGYTDLFLGAGVGPGLEFVMAPSLAADVSLTPALKLRAEYDFAFAYAEVNAGSSYDNLGTLTVRTRPWGNWWFEVAGRAGADRFTVVGTAEEDIPGHLITAYDVLSISPQLRYLGDQVDASIAYALVSTTSQGFIEDNPEYEGTAQELAQRAIASLAWSPASWLGARFQYRLTYNDADVPELLYWSNEWVAVAAARWRQVWLRLEAGLQHTNFSVFRVNGSGAYQRVDDLLHASLGLSFPIRDAIWLEASYGYAQNFSTDKDPTVTAWRHMAYLGLRVEIDPWRYR
jgi:hypothetical protein